MVMVVYYVVDGPGGENVPSGGKVPGVDLARMVAGVCRGQKKSGTRRTARGLERKGTKRRSIAELVGYKKSGGDMARKVKFETVMGSAPTISVR